MKKLCLAISLLLAISISITAQNGWKTLDDGVYTVNYPETWEMNHDGEMGTRFFVFSPVENDQDQFRENVNLTTEDLMGLSISLDEYASLAGDQLRGAIGNFALLESQQQTLNGMSYHQVIFTGAMETMELMFEQHYYIANNTAYVLTFTCANDQFDRYRETGETILRSFTLK